MGCRKFSPERNGVNVQKQTLDSFNEAQFHERTFYTQHNQKRKKTPTSSFRILSFNIFHVYILLLFVFLAV